MGVSFVADERPAGTGVDVAGWSAACDPSVSFDAVRPETTLRSPGEDEAVETTPCSLPARAWWGDRLVAESTGAVRVDEPGQPPALYFPCADVRFDLFRDEGQGPTCPVKGTARLWSIAGWTPTRRRRRAVAGAREARWRTCRRHRVLDVAEPARHEWLAGFAAFDHDRVRVELVDGVDGDAPRDVTVKRFPTWGDAADLVDLLDVRPDGERPLRQRRPAADWRRPVVEGSQMLGQAIVAAGRHAPGRRAVSAPMVFLRAADAAPAARRSTLDELSAGRTFTDAGRRTSTRTAGAARPAPCCSTPPPPT